MTDFLYSDLEKMGMEELWGHPDEEIYKLLFPPSHSKEIWKRYSNFVTLTNWREADVWQSPMDITLLPVRQMNLEELYQLHKSLLRIHNDLEERGVSYLDDDEAICTFNSLRIVEQWIYYREIVETQIEAGSPKKYYVSSSNSCRERGDRKGSRRRFLFSRQRHFGRFWDYFVCYQ